MDISEQVQAMTVLSNLNNMRSKIGLTPLDVEWQLENRSLEELREEQNRTILHYNEAINNKNQ